MDDDGFKKALNLAYFYLKFRIRTRKEMVDYLKKKSKKFQFNENTINKVIEKLEALDFINDKKFIELYINTSNKLKPKGPFALKQELVKHGIEKGLINDYFENYQSDDLTLAVQALTPRWLRLKSLSRDKRFNKMAGFLSRRGFSYDIVKRTIDHFEKNDRI